MNSSYSCLSFSRIPGRRVERRSFISHNGRIPRCPRTLLPPPKLLPSTPLQKITHLLPFASVSSSFEGDNETPEEIDKHVEEGDFGELPAMAKAFHVSLRTASAICICIAFAALTLPLTMKSLTQVAGAKTRALSYLTLLLGFYMAWNIGANDVANAMGTSVGSGALTLRQAVFTAAVLEFSGALLMGTHVTSTMQSGILVASVFQEKTTLLFAGLLSSLAAAGTWLQVCFSIP